MAAGFDGHKLTQEISQRTNVIVKSQGSVTYVMHAPPGSKTKDRKWSIRKVVCSTVDGYETTVVTWANGDALFNKIADDFLSYSYS